ncbi:MAG: hypothetical protein PVH65_07010 [Chloroflexota bacterium]
MMEIRDLPEGDDPITTNEMTRLLVKALPEKDRPEARRILADEILAAQLGRQADDPAPKRLAELVYEDLIELLEDVPPEERLQALKAEAQVLFVEEQLGAALTLGIARYIQENPEARAAAGEWLDEEVEAWIARPTTDIKEEATSRLDALETWETRAKDRYPEAWESDRLTYVHAKLTLQGARSGSFDTATGSFRDFLLDVGAAPDDLAIF